MNKDKCKVCNTELEAPNANYDEWHCCNCITNAHRLDVPAFAMKYEPKAKHTEGQWVVQNPHHKTGVRVSKKITKGSVGNIHYQYVSIADITDGEYEGEQEANANLIASAPEMLKALKNIANFYFESRTDFQDKVYALIARAEGKDTRRK